MKGTSIRLSDEDLDKITKLADNVMSPLADIVREAIRSYGKESEGKQILETLNEIKAGLVNKGIDQTLYIVQTLDLVARIYITLMAQIKKSQERTTPKRSDRKLRLWPGNSLNQTTSIIPNFRRA